MSPLKLMVTIACLSLLFVNSASAQTRWQYRNGYRYAYGPPVYAYPPVVVVPPPVVVGPAPVYPALAAPVYGPPVYGYGYVGPFGRRRVIPGPGVGVYAW